MRKPRAIIYDDDAMTLELMKLYFTRRGYEAFIYAGPVVCPFNAGPVVRCENPFPCADIIISDYRMPKMSGVELFQRQAELGCKIGGKFKAIMTGFSDSTLARQCSDLGCRLFQKPVPFSALTEWLSECEKLFDLSRQSGGKRLQRRHEFIQAIEYCLDDADRTEKSIGVTVNKSHDGLGMRVFAPLTVGQMITITTGLEMPDIQATVMWCSKSGGNIYLAGLRLLNI